MIDAAENTWRCDFKILMTALHFQQIMLAISYKKKCIMWRMKDVCLLMLNPVLVVSLGKHWSPHTLKFCCRWVAGEGMCAGSSAYGVDSSCPGDSISLLHAQSDHPGFSTQAWRKRPHGAQVSSSDAPGHCRLSDAQQMSFASGSSVLLLSYWKPRVAWVDGISLFKCQKAWVPEHSSEKRKTKEPLTPSVT